MKYLLDTHALLWFLNDDPQLPKKVSSQILSNKNKCYLSIASLWEISIKINIGKLTLKMPFEELYDYLFDNDIEVLHISFDHLVVLTSLDLHHRDPFDRLIIAQSKSAELTIISKDANFAHYNADLFWAEK